MTVSEAPKALSRPTTPVANYQGYPQQILNTPPGVNGEQQLAAMQGQPDPDVIAAQQGHLLNQGPGE